MMMMMMMIISWVAPDQTISPITPTIEMTKVAKKERQSIWSKPIGLPHGWEENPQAHYNIIGQIVHCVPRHLSAYPVYQLCNFL